MSKWKVEVTQRHTFEFDGDKLIAAFPDEHAEAMADGETENDFIIESLHVMGSDILHDPELFEETEPAEFELDYWKDGKRP